MSQDVVRCYNRGTIWWGSRAKYIGTPDRSQKSLGIQSIFRMYDELLGGFRHCLFSIIYGIIIPTDELIFFRRGCFTTNQNIHDECLGLDLGISGISTIWTNQWLGFVQCSTTFGGEKRLSCHHLWEPFYSERWTVGVPERFPQGGAPVR